MDRLQVVGLAGWIVLALIAAEARSDEPAAGNVHTIAGIVMELRSGTPDVSVCLFDSATGLPLAKDTYKPIGSGSGQANAMATEMAILVTDERGHFRFEQVPAGKYRLVAQKWIGPFKGIFAEHGTVIQLMGTADDVLVPRPSDGPQALVSLRPSGGGIVQFDQDVGNNETFLFLSTSPPEFDPILGLNAMGTSFLQHLIGFNRMPLGKTTVIGVPGVPLHAFFFAADNSPGFATVEVPVSNVGLVRVPAEPFVAGWSDGRKTPPPELAKLMEFMEAHALTPEQLLNIPELSNANFAAHQARMQELQKELSQKIELAEGVTARVGDVLAVKGYQRLTK
jgi:hypothetical protein